MEFQEFLRQAMEAARYRAGYNLMDRKIFVRINGEDVAIDNIEVDYLDNIIINVEEE